MDYTMNIQNSIDYIEENLCEKIKVSDVAKHSHFSQFYFHRLFHAVVGEPMMEYVRKRRLSEAAIELVKTDKKVTDIALAYQFSSLESFTRAFKKIYGMTPREYRNNQRNIVLYKKRIVLEANSKQPVPAGAAIRMAA